MRVLINGQVFQTSSTRGRGIGRYARTMCAGLVEARPNWDFELLEFGHLESINQYDIPPGMRTVSYDPATKIVAESSESMWQSGSDLANWLANDRPDLFLSLSTFEGNSILPPRVIDGIPHIIVVYDLIPVLYAPIMFSSHIWAGVYSDRLQTMRDAALWLAISEATAADARRLVPNVADRVVNIGGATDSLFDAEANPVDDAAILKARGLLRPFLFVGGGDCWRKNMRGCIAAFARLPRTIRNTFELAIAGSYSPNERQRINQLAADLGVQYQIRQLGRVSDAELAALYRRCRAFLFPSLYEGLGLPVVEALLCGTAVVTSNTSSLPEYAGPAAHYCDPLDPESIADAIQSAIEEPAGLRRAERIAYGQRHTPRTVGERACEAIEQNMLKPRVSARPRLAWFAEVRPPFGLPEFYLRRIAELSREYAVEIICQPGVTDLLLSLRMKYPLVPAESFAARHAAVNYRAAVTAVDSGVGWLPRHTLPEVQQPPNILRGDTAAEANVWFPSSLMAG